MELNNLTKKRFVSDFGLPIDVFQEPYFSYKIDALDDAFDTKRKLALLEKTINVYGSSEEFFKEGNRVIKALQDQITSTDEYKELQGNDLKELSDFNLSVKQKFNFTKNLYVEPNVEKTFVSIDLIKANFNAFKNFGIIKYNNYSEFVESVTPCFYFVESKQIRQVVFGQLMPKKQVIIEENAILKILDTLSISNEDHIIIVNKDELIIEVGEDFNLESFKETIDSEFPLRIEKFKLLGLRDKKEKLYFIKDYGDDKELKAVPKVYYVQAYKKMMGIDIVDKDLTFFYEGNASRFLESTF